MNFGREFGVVFDDIHSYRDLGLILTDKTIGTPKAQTNLVKVPLRDGSLDLTERLTDDIKYEDRPIKLVFYYPGAMENWSDKFSQLQNMLHGQRKKLIFDDDIAYYYMGRVEVDEWQSEARTGKIVLQITCEPYKYDMTSSAADWLWDPLDFDTGIINEGGNISVDGTATIYFIGRRKKSYPIITCDNPMNVTFDSETYHLIAGVNKVYDVILLEGMNELTFSGFGTVTIDYIGGSL